MESHSLLCRTSIELIFTAKLRLNNFSPRILKFFQKITSNLLKLTLGCNDDNDREACDIREVCNACSEDVQQMVCANNKILVDNDEGGTIFENNLNRTDGILEEMKE